MKQIIRTDGLRLPVSERFNQLIIDKGKLNELGNDNTAVTLNFRSQAGYTAEGGGFHPVENRLERAGEEWNYIYCTDFSYQGAYGMAELCKEYDVCFPGEQVFHLYAGWRSFAEAAEFHRIWESNFISYVEMVVFEVGLTTEC